MKYYFAPLEGITGYIYRRAHHTFYPGMNRYYTPFIVPKEKKFLSAKERNDVLPEHNENMSVIPQIMTNQSEEFLRISNVLYQEYGYREINLNLGCPSKTVVSKKRGSGFLSVPKQLEQFLMQVCEGFEKCGLRLSVKTRIGKERPDEFDELLSIFCKIPLAELIIHPRVQKDFYEHEPNLQVFGQAYKEAETSGWELCYNGDLFQIADYEHLCAKFPKISAVMMGRGLLTNPMLVEEIKIRENGGSSELQEKPAVLQRFSDPDKEKDERKRRYEMHRMLLDDYKSVLSGERNVLFKMKEIWFYMSQDFTMSQYYWKKMKKAQKLSEFEQAVDALCREQMFLERTKI